MMKKKGRKLNLLCVIGICFLLVFSIGLFGCSSGGGGGESGTSAVTGTAAAGAPIVGTVNIRGANGIISLSAIASDGSFTVDVSALDPPFVIWADGTANGREVKLFSTIDGPGNANVTPATHMVMAMALEDDPETYYEENPAAPAPSSDAITAAKALILEVLSSVFATLDMPENFDLMNGQFRANGEGFDKLLDVVDFSSDAATKEVEIKDKASNETLFLQNIDTKFIDTQLTAGDANIVVTDSIDKMDQFRAIFDKLEELYATSRPDLTTLQNEFLVYMANDLLDDGYDRNDTIEAWAQFDDEGPPVGFEVAALSLYRKMEKKTLANGQTIDEKGTNYDGVWCVMSISLPNGQQIDSFITSFVQENQGDPWKWYGNQIPFLDGGDVESRAVKVTESNGQTTIYSGLNIYTEDEGNLALNNFGIFHLVVVNRALPDEQSNTGTPYNGLILSRSDIDPRYQIQNAGSLWGHYYCETHGLDIDDITEDEFVLLGVEKNGTVTHIWIDLLGKRPVKESVLAANPASYFAKITAIDGMTPAGTMPSPDIPGIVDMSWTNPTGLYADWVDIGWGNQQGTTSMNQDNPAWIDGGNLFAWSSAQFDTTKTTIYPPQWVWINVTVHDQYDRGFNTHLNYQVQ